MEQPREFESQRCTGFESATNGHTMNKDGADARVSVVSLGVVPHRRSTIATSRRHLTILFVDIVESTRWALLLGDRQWLELEERHEAIAREAIRKFHGTHVLRTGDGFVVTFTDCLSGLSAARYVVERTHDLGIDIRAALHCGECEMRGRRPGGIAFHICARIMALATAGEILVSRAVREVAPTADITFVDRGRHALRGLPGEWELYRAQEAERTTVQVPRRTTTPGGYGCDRTISAASWTAV